MSIFRRPAWFSALTGATTPDKWLPTENDAQRSFGAPKAALVQSLFGALSGNAYVVVLPARERTSLDKYDPGIQQPQFDLKRQQSGYPSYASLVAWPVPVFVPPPPPPSTLFQPAWVQADQPMFELTFSVAY